MARVVKETIDLTFKDSASEIVKYFTIEAFGEEHWLAMTKLLGGESGLNPYAINPESGACGIFQALPCSKLGCELSDIKCQAKWGVKYIKDRYGTPTEAYRFWLNQSPRHWY